MNEAAEIIHSVAHPDANIIFGAVIDDSMGDEVRVTVIAAGFERWEEVGGRPSQPSSSAPEGRGRQSPDSPPVDIFAEDADDELDLGDDDFDVPSFLR